MRKWSKVLLFACVVVACAATVATAEKKVSVESANGTAATPIDLGYSLSSAACQIGNLNSAAYAIYNFLTPPEDYKLVFKPRKTCSACPDGFNVSRIHLYLQTKAACTVVMSVDLERATLQSAGCYGPGPELCKSNLYQVSVPSAGFWDIGIPVAATDCPVSVGDGCFSMSAGPYCLSVHFESMSCTAADIGLITDAGPTGPCLNWNDYGTGWYDIYAAISAWPGQLKFFADAACCQRGRVGKAPKD